MSNWVGSGSGNVFVDGLDSVQWNVEYGSTPTPPPPQPKFNIITITIPSSGTVTVTLPFNASITMEVG